MWIQKALESQGKAQGCAFRHQDQLTWEKAERRTCVSHLKNLAAGAADDAGTEVCFVQEAASTAEVWAGGKLKTRLRHVHGGHLPTPATCQTQGHPAWRPTFPDLKHDCWAGQPLNALRIVRGGACLLGSFGLRTEVQTRVIFGIIANAPT